MTDWTARIDALLDHEPALPGLVTDASVIVYQAHHMIWTGKRLSLAAERLREPHWPECFRGVSLAQPISDNPDEPVRWVQSCCTCGKDDDLRRILEGK